jgi:hypothetical protein
VHSQFIHKIKTVTFCGPEKFIHKRETDDQLVLGETQTDFKESEKGFETILSKTDETFIRYRNTMLCSPEKSIHKRETGDQLVLGEAQTDLKEGEKELETILSKTDETFIRNRNTMFCGPEKSIHKRETGDLLVLGEAQTDFKEGEKELETILSKIDETFIRNRNTMFQTDFKEGEKELETILSKTDETFIRNRNIVLQGCQRQLRLVHGLTKELWELLELTFINVDAKEGEHGDCFLLQGYKLSYQDRSRVVNFLGFECAAKFCLLEYAVSLNKNMTSGYWRRLVRIMIIPRKGVELKHSEIKRRKYFLSGNRQTGAGKYSCLTLSREVGELYYLSLQQYDVLKEGTEPSTAQSQRSLECCSFPGDDIVNLARINCLKRIKGTELQALFSARQFWGGSKYLEKIETFTHVSDILKSTIELAISCTEQLPMIELLHHIYRTDSMDRKRKLNDAIKSEVIPQNAQRRKELAISSKAGAINVLEYTESKDTECKQQQVRVTISELEERREEEVTPLEYDAIPGTNSTHILVEGPSAVKVEIQIPDESNINVDTLVEGLSADNAEIQMPDEESNIDVDTVIEGLSADNAEIQMRDEGRSADNAKTQMFDESEESAREHAENLLIALGEPVPPIETMNENLRKRYSNAFSVLRGKDAKEPIVFDLKQWLICLAMYLYMTLVEYGLSVTKRENVLQVISIVLAFIFFVVLTTNSGHKNLDFFLYVVGYPICIYAIGIPWHTGIISAVMTIQIIALEFNRSLHHLLGLIVIAFIVSIIFTGNQGIWFVDSWWLLLLRAAPTYCVLYSQRVNNADAAGTIAVSLWRDLPLLLLQIIHIFSIKA